MKIAVVVHGRFYAFDLVRALVELGVDVMLFTNYPKSIVEKWGVPKSRIESFLIHGVMSKLIEKIKISSLQRFFEPGLHSLFSKWAAKKIARKNYDVVGAFSGVAEELFKALHSEQAVKIVFRGSAHICEQLRILQEEEARVGIAIDKPSAWRIEREKKEYALADAIEVLSSFAFDSFVNQGIDKNKLHVLTLSADASSFRPGQAVVDRRIERICSRAPLRVLMSGTFSCRKGAYDFEKMVSALPEGFRFRFVGAVHSDAQVIFLRAKRKVDMVPRVSESHLSEQYEWADLFIFPTLEDGYAIVVNQALMAGLPVLCTQHCCGPDIINEDKTGWVLPIRKPELFVKRLQWCDSNREELVRMVRTIYDNSLNHRTWSAVAADFTSITKKLLLSRRRCEEK